MIETEHLDVFDEMGRHRGVRDRVTVHAEGWWHQVFHLLVVAPRDAGPTAVLQRRARHKLTFPGLVDLTATGHLAAGESPLDGVRELREELGVDLAADQLTPLGVRRMVDETPEGLNREFCHVFVAIDDRPLHAYSPDPDEVESVVEVDLAGLVALLDDAVPTVDALEARAGGDPVPSRLTAADFVPEPPLFEVAPSRPGYWLTVLAMGERLVAHGGPVSI